MAAEREALKMGVENPAALFPLKTQEIQFAVENEKGNTKYKIDTQTMRLLGLCNDHVVNVCVHSDIVELESKRRKNRGDGLHMLPDQPLARVLLPLEDTSDEDPPRSPPELYPPRSPPESFSPTMTASPLSPPGDPYFDTPEFDTPDTGDSPETAQEILSISSYSSNSNTCISSSLVATIEYVGSPVQHNTATYDHADADDHGIRLHLAEQSSHRIVRQLQKTPDSESIDSL